MKQVISCRRTFISLVAILALLILGLAKGADVALSIASVAAAICAANAAEKRGKPSPKGEPSDDK